MFASSRSRRGLDIWPGFVDALAALLMVVIFLLLIFTLGQFVLSDALSGRDRQLANLSAQVAELGDLLSLEKSRAARLSQRNEELLASLGSTREERDELAASLGESQARANRLAGDIAALEELRRQLEAEVAQLSGSLASERDQLVASTELSNRQASQIELLNRQMQALREQLGQLSEALEVAETSLRQKDITIEDLGRKLNVALADKVQELARFRSDFFGRLKQALGDNPNLRVVGDRFVFQSELLFPSASAQLGEAGKQQVQQLAQTLKDIAPQIPGDIDWVVRIDGHTDRRPISTAQFPSNWELSTARAVAIVKYLIDLGINPERLAATGFGEYHPLVAGDSEAAYASNRRIEIKLTSR